MRRARNAASRPGATPQRSMPTSISTSPPSTTPKSRATRDAASSWSGASKHSAMVASLASPPQLALANHLIAHQHVLHAAANEHFRFADLLHALADRAETDLP